MQQNKTERPVIELTEREVLVAKISTILGKYDETDYELFKSSIQEFAKKGFANGCFQDYTMMSDIIEILATLERIVKATPAKEMQA